MRQVIIVILTFYSFTLVAQNWSTDFNGSFMPMTNISNFEEPHLYSAIRFIPELSFERKIDTFQSVTFFGSLNTYADWDYSSGTSETNAEVDFYRLWVRYINKGLEVRLGSQKIEFGTAAILRPLQWFNTLDPRDPFQLTYGVKSILGRYYFSNNANIWLWTLYDNSGLRGLDAVPNVTGIPEYGGRFQLPLPNGELGMSYNNRKAFLQNVADKIQEHRFGLDVKLNYIFSIWAELSHAHKMQDIGNLTLQTQAMIGMDYTVPVGNGLSLLVENMVLMYNQDYSFDQKPLWLTAASLNYPIGFFDQISFIYYTIWEGSNHSFVGTYQHQFSSFTGFLMAYYSPESISTGIRENDLSYQFSGPGVRVMILYNI